MTDGIENRIFTVDDIAYVKDELPEVAKSEIINIQFCDDQIRQLQNELAISSTAHSGYLRLLKAELAKRVKTSG